MESPMSRQISVRVIRSIPEIEDIREIWTSWQNHPNADIDFYLMICRSSPQFVHPHVLLAYRDGSPEAMLIGRIEHRRIDCKIGYRILFRPKARVLNFVYGGVLGKPSPDITHALLKSIMNLLRQREVDVAYFNVLRTDSPFWDPVTRVPGISRGGSLSTLQVHRSTMLPGSVEEFHRALSGTVRKNQRWSSNKLRNDYRNNVRIRCFRGTSELDQMIKDAEEVAKKTYQRGLGVGFVDNPAMRQRLELEAGKGWLCSYVLYVADRPSAFWIGTLYQDTYHSNFMGYDANLSKYSPGMFLIMRAVEQMCTHNGDKRVVNIDWGLGDAQYKQVLGTCQWQESSVPIFAPTLKGFSLKLLVAATTFAERLITKPLERTGLLRKIKKTWRRRVSQAVSTAAPSSVNGSSSSADNVT